MRFVVIGSGKTAIDIARALVKDARATLCGVVGDPRRETAQSSLRAEAEKLALPYHETRRLSDPATLAFLQAARPDYVVSANNFLLFRKATLEIARLATINFHNGPLPAYAGLNPFCWALINGETRYGITWHVVDEGIDSGDVLHIEPFDVDPDETAAGMVIKCVRAGIASFRSVLLPRLLDQDLAARAQDTAERRYYSARDVPHGGWLPWWLPRNELLRILRAVAFAPLPNLFYRPRLMLPDGQELSCSEADFVADAVAGRPGTIMACDQSSITVAVEGGLVVARDIHRADPPLAQIDPMSLGVGAGLHLVQPSLLGEQV